MSKNKKIIIPLVVIALILLGAGVYWQNSKQMAVSGHTSSSIPAAKSKQSGTSHIKLQQTAQGATKSAKSTSTKSSINSTTNLQTPFGSFVSNHNPSLSNASYSYELSSCETTPGVVCLIEFTGSAGQRIELAPQQADSQGVTSWSWNLSKEGFSPGKWQIEAIAKLNNQTKTAYDSLGLSVQQ